MERLRVLNNPKLFNKLCKKLNKDFQCRDAFGCHISCPLHIANTVEYLMNAKRLPLGEAYRLTMREAVDEKDAKQILGALVVEKKPYPPDLDEDDE